MIFRKALHCLFLHGVKWAPEHAYLVVKKTSFVRQYGYRGTLAGVRVRPCSDRIDFASSLLWAHVHGGDVSSTGHAQATRQTLDVHLPGSAERFDIPEALASLDPIAVLTSRFGGAA